jgi:hypothetical protein
MLAAAVRRVEEGRCRRVRAAERAIVPDVGPQAADLRLLLGEHRHGRVVGVDTLGGEDMALDRQDQRHRGRADGADPIRQGRDVDLDAFPGVDRALPVEREVVPVLRDQHQGQQTRAGAATGDRMARRRRLRDCLAGAAAELLAGVLDHLPGARHGFQALGHILAELPERAAAVRAGARSGIDDPLAWQVLGQRAPGRLAGAGCALAAA